MDWVKFTELRDKLMRVNSNVLKHIADNSKPLGDYPKVALDLIAWVQVFNIFRESDFSDLTYRYVVSDKDLGMIDEELDSLNRKYGYA